MIQAQDQKTRRTLARVSLAGPNSSGARRKPLETRGLGEVHPKAVAPTLVAGGHFRLGVADEASPVRNECPANFSRRSRSERSPRTPACGDRQALDKARDVSVVELFGSDLAPDHRPEQGPTRNAREFEPSLERGHRASALLRSAADLDLAPGGFGGQSEEHAVVCEFRPARALKRILGAHD